MNDRIRPSDETNVKQEDPLHRGISYAADTAAGMPMEAGKSATAGGTGEVRPMVALSMTIDEAVIVSAVLHERGHQRRRWGRNHDRRHQPVDWTAILSEQVGKFAAAATKTIETDFQLGYHPSQPDFEVMERRATVIMAVAMAFLETMQEARR